MTVLVTGGTGFVGGTIVRTLVKHEINDISLTKDHIFYYLYPSALYKQCILLTIVLDFILKSAKIIKGG